MQEVYEKLRESYIKRLRSAEFPDKVYIYYNRDKALTPNQMADEIENKTAIGDELIKSIIMLATELIVRDQTKM